MTQNKNITLKTNIQNKQKGKKSMRLAINQGWAYELVTTTDSDILAVDAVLNKL
jgi:hypothetical protein